MDWVTRGFLNATLHGTWRLMYSLEKSSGVECVDWDPIALLMDGELTCFQFSWFIACLPLVSGLIYKSWRVCVFDAKI